MRFRLGCSDIMVNKGRMNRTPRAERLCTFCDKNVVEDERHVLLECTAYTEARGLGRYASLTELHDEHMQGDDRMRAVMNTKHQTLLADLLYDTRWTRNTLVEEV